MNPKSSRGKFAELKMDDHHDDANFDPKIFYYSHIKKPRVISLHDGFCNFLIPLIGQDFEYKDSYGAILGKIRL